MAKKQGTVSFFQNRIVFLILSIAVIFMGITAVQLFTKERQAKARKDEVHRELAHITDRRAVLEKDLALLETDRGREGLVRANTDVARPGEEIYVLLDPPEIATSTEPEQKGLWAWVLGIFK